jgi:hypothetical protein
MSLSRHSGFPLALQPCVSRLELGATQHLFRAVRLSATSLEHGRVPVAVGLRRLYSETSHWHGDFVADRMTASGRQREYQVAPRS